MAASRTSSRARRRGFVARCGRTLRLLVRYFRVNLAANTAYPVPFAIQVVAMAANNAMFMAFWAILFEAIEAPIRGYTFTDVMFLWAVAAAGFGLGSIVCGNAAYLSRIIYQGDLDVYLTQPKPVLPNLLASRMSVSSWGDLLYGLGLFAISQPLTPAGIGLFLLFVLLAAGVLVAVRVLYHSLTFLLGNAEDLAGVGSEQIINFSLYPGTIFDGPVVAVILHTLIPAALVAHLPAELFRAVARGMGLDWSLLAAIVGGDAALIAAAWVVFALGPAPLRVRQPHRSPHLTAGWFQCNSHVGKHGSVPGADWEGGLLIRGPRGTRFRESPAPALPRPPDPSKSSRGCRHVIRRQREAGDRSEAGVEPAGSRRPWPCPRSARRSDHFA